MLEDFDFNFDDNQPDPTGAGELYQKLLENSLPFSNSDSVCTA